MSLLPKRVVVYSPIADLRTKLADREARLKAVRALGWALEGVYRDTAGRALDRATDLRVKNWRSK